MGLEHISHVSDIVFIPVQKVPLWIRHGVLITPSIHTEVLTEVEKSLWNVIHKTTSGICFVEILYVLQDYFGGVMGR